MLDFGFYNEDCLPRMREYPDKYFDLAIVDPPYGGGFTEGGGCQGWFSKYHQNNGEDISKQASKQAIPPLMAKNIGIASEGGSIDTSLSRTGGTWAAKYGKKSYRGM